MNERCKNCKVSRCFEDGALGPESSLTIEQSLEHIKSMETNKKENHNWETGKDEPNPYYMENCDDYDWFYKGN